MRGTHFIRTLLLLEEIFNRFVAGSLPAGVVLQPLGLGGGSRGAGVGLGVVSGAGRGCDTRCRCRSHTAHASQLGPSLCSRCRWSPLLCPRTHPGCRDTFARLGGSRKAPSAKSIAGKLSPASAAEHTPSSCHPTEPFAVQTRAPTRLLEGSMTLHQHKTPPKKDQTPSC